MELSLGKGLTNHYNQHDDMGSLRDVIGILEANKQKKKEVPFGTPMENNSLDTDHGLVHAMHAALHLEKQQRTEGGHLINELHPPLKVTVNRITKVRRIPNHGGEIVRKVPADAKLVALGTTPDFVWLQVGHDEFILARDCSLEENKKATKPEVIPLEPPLPIHVKEEVTVRKLPSVNGKAVGLLQGGDLITATGATPDYSWIQIGHKQFIPSVFAKLGNPTTPLDPPVTVHVIADVAKVRDIPSYEGAVITTLSRDDVFKVIAVSSDMKWLKIAKNNYIPAATVKVGMPQPTVIRFPEPIMVTLANDTAIVKNPNEPQWIINSLKQNDEVLAIGTTADFKWLQLGHKRFIAMETARLKSAIPEPIKLEPAIPIKLAIDTPVRHIPDNRGRMMAILKKGEKTEAIGVSADFSWLQLAEHMFIPLANAFFRRAEPVVNPVVPPMSITLRKDATVYKRPEEGAKVVRTLTLGDALTVVATTPDLEWLKIGNKEFIKADTAIMKEKPATSPLYPAVKVVVIRDTKIFKSPEEGAMVVRRIKRGETLKAGATTNDLKWLVLSDNEYILTDDVAHIPSTTPLKPAVKIVIASTIKVRNVPAFSGRAVKTLKRGEVVMASEVTLDYKWFKIGKHMYVPAAACSLHESEGKNLILVVKARNTPLPAKPQVVHPAMRTPAPPSAQHLASRISSVRKIQEQTNAEKVHELEQHISNNRPVNPLTQMKQFKEDNVLAKKDAYVYSKPDDSAEKVNQFTKDTIVNVRAMDNNANWMQINQDEYIKTSDTLNNF